MTDHERNRPHADAVAEDSRARSAGKPRGRRSCTAVEAVLFSSPRPVREKDLADAARGDARGRAGGAGDARRADGRAGARRPLEKVAGGWRFVTRPEFDALLRKFHEVTERSRLSLAALETLAIIAYRQPITLPEIQDIRGVNSSSVLKTLFEKKLITTAGKKAVVGTPVPLPDDAGLPRALRLERARRSCRGPRSSTRTSPPRSRPARSPRRRRRRRSIRVESRTRPTTSTTRTMTTTTTSDDDEAEDCRRRESED